jgi:Protein of unknown function (DUF1353)
MGFQQSATNSSRPDRIQLKVIDHKRFQLMNGFAYVAENLQVVEVPPHDPNNDKDTTDLASVPRLLWGLLPSYGRQLRAALMHDHLCDLVNRYPANKRKDAAKTRRRADELFREAMRNPEIGTVQEPQSRVPWFRSWLFWAGVSFGRIWKFHKLGGFLLTAHVLLGIVALYVMTSIVPLRWLHGIVPFGLGDHRLQYGVIYLALITLSFAWVGNARLPLIGILIGPVLVPVLIVTFVAQFLIAIPDAINRLFRKDAEPPPNFGPVVTGLTQH